MACESISLLGEEGGRDIKEKRKERGRRKGECGDCKESKKKGRGRREKKEEEEIISRGTKKGRKKTDGKVHGGREGKGRSGSSKKTTVDG